MGRSRHQSFSPAAWAAMVPIPTAQAPIARQVRGVSAQGQRPSITWGASSITTPTSSMIAAWTASTNPDPGGQGRDPCGVWSGLPLLGDQQPAHGDGDADIDDQPPPGAGTGDELRAVEVEAVGMQQGHGK